MESSTSTSFVAIESDYDWASSKLVQRLLKTRAECKLMKEELEMAQAELTAVRDEQGWAMKLQRDLEEVEWKLKLMEKMNSNVTAENELLKIQVKEKDELATRAQNEVAMSHQQNKVDGTRQQLPISVEEVKEQIHVQAKLMGSLESLTQMREVHQKIHMECADIKRRFENVSQKASNLSHL